jgi:outer membrane protein assembly factor BamB
LRQTVPSKSTPAADPATMPYERVWSTTVEADAPIALAMAPGLVVLAAEGAPLEARSVESGQVAWTSQATIDTVPIVGDGRVFGVGAGHLSAIALDRGRPVWGIPLEKTGSSPVVTGDVVAVPVADELRAYRAPDGAAIWRRSMGTPALFPPVPAGDTLVVALAGNDIAAFDRSTGAAMWRTRLDSAPGALAADADRVFLGTASTGICALDHRTGVVVWCFGTAPVPAAGAPVAHGRLVYTALRDNTLRAFDAEGGTLKRLESLPARPAAGPLRAGAQLAVPMTTGAFALLALEGPRSAPALAFDPPAGHALEAAAASADGTWLVTLTVELNERRSLAGYRRKAAAPTAAP